VCKGHHIISGVCFFQDRYAKCEAARLEVFNCWLWNECLERKGSRFIAIGVEFRDNGVVDLRTVPGTGEEDQRWFGFREQLLAVALIGIREFCY